MARKRRGLRINGWVNLDKPVGMTSTQALGKVRWLLKAQKAGHAGTLDPLATGILPIALGEATKTIPYVQDSLKIYEFEVTWGEARDTDDAEGEVIETSDKRPTRAEIEGILNQFTGEIEQTPPKYSAIKINGERAYDLARAGEDVQIKSRHVYIETMKLRGTEKNSATFQIVCGKGTYVRSLARDMGKTLGTCGYISKLRRTQVGAFDEKDTISLDFLESLEHSAALNEAVLPLEVALDDIPALPMDQNETARLRNGNELSFVSRSDFERLQKADINTQDGDLAIATFQGKAIAIVDVHKANVRPVKVFNV